MFLYNVSIILEHQTVEKETRSVKVCAFNSFVPEGAANNVHYKMQENVISKIVCMQMCVRAGTRKCMKMPR